jgi:DNA-binding NarL/FixJ family response regulator
VTAVRVALGIGNAVAREGVVAVLEAGDIDVVAATGDPAVLVAATREHGVDVCVVDTSLPGECTATVDALRRTGGAIVVLTETEDEQELLRMVEAGACGLLPQHLVAHRLPDVLRGVAAGEAAVSRRLVRRLLDRLGTERRTLRLADATGRPVELSPREAAVLEMLAAGVSAGDAARRLGISPVTARRHVSAAVHKLGAADRAAAIALVREHAG